MIEADEWGEIDGAVLVDLMGLGYLGLAHVVAMAAVPVSFPDVVADVRGAVERSGLVPRPIDPSLFHFAVTVAIFDRVALATLEPALSVSYAGSPPVELTTSERTVIANILHTARLRSMVAAGFLLYESPEDDEPIH